MENVLPGAEICRRSSCSKVYFMWTGRDVVRSQAGGVYIWYASTTNKFVDDDKARRRTARDGTVPTYAKQAAHTPAAVYNRRGDGVYRGSSSDGRRRRRRCRRGKTFRSDAYC